MIKVGLTGSIGSGKSLVASIFEHLGIPVYHADAEAKKNLLVPSVIELLTDRFGPGILDEFGQVDRKTLALKVFSDPSELAFLNSIIHPLVKSDFDEWLLLHENCSYIIQEAAILFESGFDSFFDKTIVVSAPEEVCISRVIKRDATEASEVLERMSNQWEPAIKVALADYVLLNDGIRMVLPQVLELHAQLLELSKNQ